MAELTTLARPYAKAAFEIAQPQKQLTEWSGMLSILAVVATDERVKTLLSQPSVKVEAKADAFIAVCGEYLSEAGKNFVRLLAENKRLSLLPEISVLFEELKAQQESTVQVLVESAYELSDAQKDSLIKSLQTKLGRSVNMQITIDKTLLGGVVIRAEDLVIDASVRGRIAKLAEALHS
jgi:F-type H+-transporting ATPase subunit delta